MIDNSEIPDIKAKAEEALENWDSLTMAQKDKVLKNLLRFAVKWLEAY